ncbi:hypothetical protein BV22DRAFT_1135735 [Leucogyrophana mollusca]|uniref:Uncharacterized protein n=1 Tax=Leucogyrophana mollusca TaxID=85980 RepID=A0ACB8AUM6_9AGAM|nr:hypothetical protein BV22DRAFT_1135735 [Leucogyrophana mollusca]
MYTNSGGRGVRHEWTPSVRRIGIASYVNVHIFRLSHGSSYTSLACPSLGCSAFIRVPATHLIFSFGTASSNIVLHALETDAAHPFALITLCPLTAGILRELCARAPDISAAVRAMIQARKVGSESVRSDSRLTVGLDADNSDTDEDLESLT